MISSLYLYTGTPPLGYGTQAPKVAETVIRAYGFNRKKENKTLTINGKAIERMQWEKRDGPFPHHVIHGNFIPSQIRIMTESFLKANYNQIDNILEKTMQKATESNSDILTKGRQTYDPFYGSSVTSAVAYRRFFDFLHENLGDQGFGCLDWIKAFFMTMNKSEVTMIKKKWERTEVKTFDRKSKQRVTIVRKSPKYEKITFKGKDEIHKAMFPLLTIFASYIKHKERGKKDRRAIASAGMMLRMFLHIIEEFHLELAKHIEGSTISIGGEEKKAKIINNMANKSLKHNTASSVIQGTEDATKWNECLSPGAFALMHHFMTCPESKKRLGLPSPTKMALLFQRIAWSAHYIMANKEVQIGVGLLVQNDKGTSRLMWEDDNEGMMSSNTLEWYKCIKEYITEDREYIRASPGMLMGMLNAAWTTLGLLATNHNMDPSKMRVVTLRSSDDSMTLYLGNDVTSVRDSVAMNNANLSLIGINLSVEKTFFFREGFGEYTSWYMDENFVSQFGVETASIRPQGKNPADDFYSVGKGTSTALSTLTINPLGASMRLRLGIDGVRRLWRIKKKTDERPGVNRDVLLMSDGGRCLWNCMNSHLEETSLKERHAKGEEEKKYLLKVRNPENPFSEEVEEEMIFSKETGTLVLDYVETPRTVFHYVKRSNRTLRGKIKESQEREERHHGEAIQIIKSIDPTTMIEYPNSKINVDKNMIAMLEFQRSALELSPSEELDFQRALSILRFGQEEEDCEDLMEGSDEENWDI